MYKFRECCLLVITLLVLNTGQAAKLVINRCELPNGTVAFQETPCPEKAARTITSPKITSPKTSTDSPSAAVLHKPQPRLSPQPVGHQQITKTNQHRSSVTMTQQVRGYTVSIPMLSPWQFFSKVYNDKLLHMKALSDEPGMEMSLVIDFIFPDYKTFSDEELNEIVYLLGSQFIGRAIERNLQVNKINVTGGKGMITTVTMKRSDIEYRYITKGTIYKNDWLIQFTLKSANIDSQNHQFALQSLAHAVKIDK